MELLKVTKGGALHFKLSDGRLGVSYESGYVRVSTKRKTELSGKLYQINKMIKVSAPNEFNRDDYWYKRVLIDNQRDRINLLFRFNNNNCI
jgi:hypothetical protein|tara:strand:- start:320 stop:592 length:273 start_codon:yes stop_codon:yes gene_type:complete